MARPTPAPRRRPSKDERIYALTHELKAVKARLLRAESEVRRLKKRTF